MIFISITFGYFKKIFCTTGLSNLTFLFILFPHSYYVKDTTETDDEWEEQHGWRISLLADGHAVGEAAGVEAGEESGCDQQQADGADQST